MTHYSVQPQKKNIGKNISKNLSSNQNQKYFGHAEQSAIFSRKTASKKSYLKNCRTNL